MGGGRKGCARPAGLPPAPTLAAGAELASGRERGRGTCGRGRCGQGRSPRALLPACVSASGKTAFRSVLQRLSVKWALSFSLSSQNKRALHFPCQCPVNRHQFEKKKIIAQRFICPSEAALSILNIPWVIRKFSPSNTVQCLSNR